MGDVDQVPGRRSVRQPSGVSSRARPTIRAAAFALLGVGFWSTNALAGDTALEQLPVMQVILLQFLAASVLLTIFRLVRRGRDDAVAGGGSGMSVHAAVVGLIGLGGTLTCQYVAFAHAPIVDTNVIAYSWPMMAAMVLAVTSFGRSTLIGLALSVVGFAGIVLIVTGQGVSADGGGNPVLGYGSALGSAACMAFYTLGVRHVSTSVVDSCSSPR